MGVDIGSRTRIGPGVGTSPNIGVHVGVGVGVGFGPHVSIASTLHFLIISPIPFYITCDNSSNNLPTLQPLLITMNIGLVPGLHA